MRAAITVAATFEKVPLDYVEAQEVLREIWRCRRAWSRRGLVPLSVKRLLRSRREIWREILRDPSYDLDHAIAEYVPVAERGTAAFLETQRANRREVVGKQSILNGLKLEALDPFVRGTSMKIWAEALNGAPEMRDYADWLLPSLTKVRISGEEWSHFWLQEILPDNMPQCRLHSVVEFVQAFSRISHGNALDTTRAGYSRHCDIIVTADKAFYEAIGRVRTLWCGRENLALPILVDRGAKDASNEIVDAIRSTLQLPKIT
jgi:hypothetical protein